MLLLLVVLALVASTASAQNGYVWAYNSATETYAGNGDPCFYGINTQLNGGMHTLTFGAYATTLSSIEGVAGGYQASALGNYAVAWGPGATANLNWGTSVGSGASSGTEAFAGGAGANAAGYESSAVGFGASSYGPRSVSIGPFSTSAQESIAIGQVSQATGTQAIANGWGAIAATQFSVITGVQATSGTTGQSSSAYGSFSVSSGYGSAAYGTSSSATENGACAFGSSANAAAVGAVCLGESCIVTAAARFGIATGQNSQVNTPYGIATGVNAFANVMGGIAHGYNATTNSVNASLAFGTGASPLGAANALAFSLNTASIVAQGLGLTLNGVAYQVPAYTARLASTSTSGTTTLTALSAPLQWFTATQTVVLPVATTLQAGAEYTVTNLSSGSITVKTSGGTSFATLAKNTSTRYVCNNPAGGVGTASWTAIGPTAAVA